MEKTKTNSIKNPCVRVCGYNDDNICTSCFRTKKEIFQWGDFTNEKRREIIILTKARKKKING